MHRLFAFSCLLPGLRLYAGNILAGASASVQKFSLQSLHSCEYCDVYDFYDQYFSLHAYEETGIHRNAGYEDGLCGSDSVSCPVYYPEYSACRLSYYLSLIKSDVFPKLIQRRF